MLDIKRDTMISEIIEEIGSGPSAHVYQAVNKSTKKQVALKVLNPDVGQSASILTELQRAVVVASNLDDSHIAKVYDLGEDDGYHYIASEFIDGVPLQNLIQHYRKFALLFKRQERNFNIFHNTF